MSDLQDEVKENPGEYGSVACGGSEVDYRDYLARARYVGKPRRANWRGGLGKEVKRGIRGVASGLSVAAAARAVNLSSTHLARELTSPAGRAYLAKHRERVDAHRVLLAATVPFLDLLRAIETGKRPVRTYTESGEDDAGE